MKIADPFSDFPGGALVERGLRDLQSGLETIPACLVRITRDRFVRADLLPESCSGPGAIEPERQLYRLLLAEGGDAYSRYNSLLRELDSFHRALELRNRRWKNEE
ncbi:MAG: hypothetical protein M3Q46_03975 [Verrucomicrobiota bacterium]|nr:hypothetical protein [Verrucomicrobiota bacterium]